MGQYTASIDIQVLNAYLDTLQKSFLSDTTNARNVRLEIKKGRRFWKIVSYTSHGFNSPESGSVHAFVEVATGKLIKAAGWNAPQFNTDKTVAARWYLMDGEDRELLFKRISSDPGALFGGYLYADGRNI